MKNTVILSTLVAVVMLIAGCQSSCNPPCAAPCPAQPCHQDLKGEG